MGAVMRENTAIVVVVIVLWEIPQSIPTLLYFCIKLPYGISLTQAHIPDEVNEPKACRKPQAFVLALSNNIFTSRRLCLTLL